MSARQCNISHGDGSAGLAMSEAEIGKVLGLTRAGVSSVQRRAIRRLWRDSAKLQRALVEGRRIHPGAAVID